MVQVVLIVREIGRKKPDYSLKFDLPAVPAVGSFVSIQRPDKPEPFGEDVVVRQVWWRLNHPETNSVLTDGREKIGSLNEIFVECDPALTPYSSDKWRSLLESAKSRGDVQEIDSERFSVRESDLKK
jgi:hypothetical protein